MTRVAIAIFVVAFCFGLLGFLFTGKPPTPNHTGTDSSLVSTAIPGQNIPDATGYVNDTASVLGPTTDLEAKLKAFADGGKGEVAVLTVTSLNGLSIEEFGIRVAEKWKVGKYGQDNGVIIIISTGDRKARIEVGSGANVTDGQAQQILTGIMVPKLKDNNYAAAVQLGVDAIISQLNK